jgi:hypothetical protein
MTARALALACVGILAVAAFASGDPSCLRGPFGQVDQRLEPIWLDDINEMRPLRDFIRTSPLAAAASLWTPVLGLLAGVALLATGGRRRHVETWAAMGCLIVSVAMTIAHIRTSSYSIMFALPLVAGAIGVFAMLAARKGTSPFVVSVVLVGLANTVMGVLLLALVVPTSSNKEKSVSGVSVTEREPCQTLPTFSELVGEPAGLIANQVDLGPFILAATGHRVMAAPYHRFAHGILDADAVMRSRGDEARKLLAEAGATYVVVCASSPRLLDYRRTAADGLAVRLIDGQTPAWLIPLANQGPIRAFRFHPY